jgi:hypothetical protein
LFSSHVAKDLMQKLNWTMGVACSFHSDEKNSHNQSSVISPVQSLFL